jgi:CDP-diacylglycerol---glycerol-3-phosphate 3-phosphatidyltransferase
MFDGRFRVNISKVTDPVGKALVRLGVSADVLTGSGLIFAFVTAWAISRGMHWPAIFLLTATGFHDMFDGSVAKASSRVSIRGSFFDSVVDRVSDAVVIIGCADLLIREHRQELVLLPMGIMVAQFIISYARAKAESLGIPAKGGLMERAERMIVLGVALLAKPLFIPTLWVLFLLTLSTAVGRFGRVWRAADHAEVQR